MLVINYRRNSYNNYTCKSCNDSSTCDNYNYLIVYKKYIYFLLLVIFMLILVSNFVSAATISQCGNITSPGYYVLTNNISYGGTCLFIRVSNVEIDCNGSTIRYNTLGGSTLKGIDAINGTLPKTNLTVRNCILIKPSNAQTAGHGISLTRFSNSTLVNNTIYTNGTTNNYGIYLTLSSQNNIIENNTIYTNGTGNGNAGIYLLTGCNNNSIRHNTINTSGVTTGHGIVISGATTASNNNIIFNNVISTFGTGASNYGVYLLTNANNNIISENNIRTNGTTTNHGIYFGGGAGTPVNNNNITNNVILASGSLSTRTIYGLAFASNVNFNKVFNNTIVANGTINSLGVYFVGTTALTVNYNVVDSNNIRTIANVTGNHGVYFATNVNYNNFTNNNISTSGSSTNYGVYIAGSTYVCRYNLFSFNNIYTSGTAGSNYGIYLYRNVSNNIISNNIIDTNGTTTNHGIYLAGTTNLYVDNNTIDSNIINAKGFAAARTNYGIILATNAHFNNVTHNNISTYGTINNWGVYLLGNNLLNVNFNIIDSNNIQTVGLGNNANHGVYLLTNANFNNITNNNISTKGITTNVGCYISGVTFPSTNNNICNNTIRTNGTTGNYGVYLFTNASFNNVSGNDIITNGTSTNYGIYLNGATGAPVRGNILYANTLETKCSTASSLCYGIHLLNLVTNTSILENNIITGATNNNHGIYLLGTAILPVNLTTIDSNLLNIINADRIILALGVRNTTVKNNSMINKDYAHYDINISAGINETSFVDQYLENYTFIGVGGLVNVKNSNYGEINFLNPVNGTGSNFSRNVNISYNNISINSSSAIGLNRSARLTLYGLLFSNPLIMMDNSTCTDCSILDYNITSGTLVFNASHFTSYYAAENNTEPPVIDYVFMSDGEIILSAGTTHTVNCYVSVSDSLGIDNIASANATFYYYLNTSSQSDNNLVHYTDTSCDLNQTNLTNKIFSCNFNVQYYANNGTWICNATAYNNQSASVFAVNSTTINPLYAINLTDGILFGDVQSNVSSANVTVNITNLGNMPVNVTLQGYALMIGDNTAMTCSDNTNISIDAIRFSSNNTANFNQKTPMNGSIQPLNFIINKQQNSTLIFNTTYWQISPNPGSINRICNGHVIFDAQAP